MAARTAAATAAEAGGPPGQSLMHRQGRPHTAVFSAAFVEYENFASTPRNFLAPFGHDVWRNIRRVFLKRIIVVNKMFCKNLHEKFILIVGENILNYDK